jgi:ribosomal protein S18 acetylase RimI-like enzyme
MSTTLKFRNAIQEDAEGIINVYLTSRKEFVPFAPLVDSEKEIYWWIRDRLIPTNRVTVAEQDGKVIGMMALSRDNTAGWIDEFYLHPKAIGRGIGRTLIDRAKAELGSPIRVYTFQENTEAIEFYERHGFRPINYGDGSTNEEHCPDILYEWRS